MRSISDVAQLFQGLLEGVANGTVAFEGKDENPNEVSVGTTEAVRGSTSAEVVLRALTEKQ